MDKIGIPDIGIFLLTLSRLTQYTVRTRSPPGLEYRLEHGLEHGLEHSLGHGLEHGLEHDLEHGLNTAWHGISKCACHMKYKVATNFDV